MCNPYSLREKSVTRETTTMAMTKKTYAQPEKKNYGVGEEKFVQSIPFQTLLNLKMGKGP